MDLVEYGQFVIIQKKNQTSLYEVPKQQSKPWPIKIGRNQVDLTTAVGNPYGAFKLTSGQNKKVSVLEPIESVVELKNELLKDTNSGESNQEIWDDGTSQSLKKEDIDRLREKGVSGSEIISHLVENSKTFQSKTEFSQEKYVNKKEGKYTEFVEIVKPSIRLLSKHYYSQDPMKILNLRSDTLATIMSLANITAGGKYGILDGGCQGLITAAILDRIQGDGTVWNLYSKGQPQKHAVLAMNFTSEQMKPLHNTSLFKLKDLVLSNADKSTETAKEQEGGDGPPAKVPKLDPELKEQVQIENQTTETVKLEFGVLDGLIVACRRPGNISRELLKLLKPSGNFVLYCPYIEPLSETYVQLRENGMAVNLKLAELWFRNYQVLPLRTHPEVTMSGSGGYLLSGIRVVPL